MQRTRCAPSIRRRPGSSASSDFTRWENSRSIPGRTRLKKFLLEHREPDGAAPFSSHPIVLHEFAFAPHADAFEQRATRRVLAAAARGHAMQVQFVETKAKDGINGLAGETLILRILISVRGKLSLQ